MVISKRKEDDCGNGGYGNAIIHPGGVKEAATAWYFPEQGLHEDGTEKNCEVPETECRTGLCLKLGTFAGPMAQCTAHLGAGRADYEEPEVGVARTRTQSAQYLWIARSWVEPGRRMSLAGDFNLTPNQLHEAYAGLVDLVDGPTHSTRDEGGPDRQIDYIFIENVGTWSDHEPFCDELAAQASDHCFTNGDWHL